MRHQFGVALLLLCLHALLYSSLGGLHDVGDLVVGKPAVRVNNRLVELVRRHLTQRRNFHLAHHRQTVDSRL